MRYPLLDPLRGAAAVWVFLHHVVYAFGGYAPAVLKIGYLGVPMFFVISGYCLTAAARRAGRDGASAGDFLRRRWLRIFPPFWAAAAVAVLVYATLPKLGPPTCETDEYLRAAWRAVTPAEWVGMATLSTGLWPVGLPWNKFAPVNMAFWTLAIEVQFYAVVAVAVWAGPRRFYPVLAAVTVVSLPFLPSEAAFQSGWCVGLWPFFALGVGLYAALERGWFLRSAAGRWAGVAAGAGLGAWGLSAAPLGSDGSRQMLLAEFAFAVGLAVVLWARWRPADATAAPVGGVAGYLGAVSYSLYLLHFPLMFVVAHAAAGWVSPGSPAFAAVVVAAVSGLVWPFYRWVEKPFISGRRPPVSGCEAPGTCSRT